MVYGASLAAESAICELDISLFDSRYQVNLLFIINNQEEGVPQSSILAVTLFNIKINNITKELPPGIDGSLYVDDLMCSQPKYIHTIEWKLQLGLKISADGQQ